MKYEIGRKIRYFRELHGLNQKEFASQIGVSNSRVSNWEQGINRPDADIVAIICQVLDISADELLDLKPKKDIQKTPENIPESKYFEIIEMLDKLPPEQVVEVKGYIKHLVYEHESMQAAKQIRHA